MKKQTIDHKNFFYPPGGILIWVLIMLELITFGAGLIALAVSSKSNPEAFHQSRLMLNATYGAINTVFLLTGGYFMAMTVFYAKKDQWEKANSQMPLAILSGVLFLFLKGFEYYEKIEHGLTLGHNTFFNFYWLLTGFHVIHVIIGLVILAFMYFKIKKVDSAFDILDLEAGAHFWHMVDLIWLLLFPMLYLIL